MFGFELVIGGALFWLLLIGLLVLCEISTVNETHWGFAWFLIFGGILWWGFNANPFAWMLHNFGTTLIYAGIYLTAGVFWGFGRWYFYIKDAHDRILSNEKSLRQDYTDAGARTVNPYKGSFTDWLTEYNRIPLGKNNKEKISIWMFWWPFSMFWTFFDDILRRAYNAIIEQYMFIFDRINNMVFGGLNK